MTWDEAYYAKRRREEDEARKRRLKEDVKKKRERLRKKKIKARRKAQDKKRRAKKAAKKKALQLEMDKLVAAVDSEDGQSLFGDAKFDPDAYAESNAGPLNRASIYRSTWGETPADNHELSFTEKLALGMGTGQKLKRGGVGSSIKKSGDGSCYGKKNFNPAEINATMGPPSEYSRDGGSENQQRSYTPGSGSRLKKGF